MNNRVKFLLSFRARLILLLASFLLLTIVLVIALDNWARAKSYREVRHQSREVKEAVNNGFGDIAEAIGIAVQNLSSERFLYRRIEDGEFKLPDTVEDILVADKDGKVADSTV